MVLLLRVIQRALNDHLGATRVLFGSNWNANYHAYGEVAAQSGSDAENKYTFTGKEKDSGAGLTYFGWRYYDPVLGRWLTLDPAGQGWSPYAYAGNNPVIIVDRDGRIAWFVPILIGAAIGGISGGVIAHNNGAPWYQGALIGAAAGAFLGSGIAFGGAYGTAVGSAAFNAAQGYLQGGRGYDLLKYAGVGFATGYFGATGGFGLVGSKTTPAGLRIAGRLATQMIATAGRSIGNRWANPNISNSEIFDSFSFGFGPVNLRVENGLKFGWKDNIANVIVNGFGLWTHFSAKYDVRFKDPDASITWDWNSLSFNYKNQVMEDFVGQWGASATGAYAIQNGFSAENILEEGVHVWQSRFFGNLFLRVYWWNFLPAGLNYYRNFFERQAHGYHN